MRELTFDGASLALFSAALYMGKNRGFNEMFESFWESVDRYFAQTNFTF